MDNNVFYYSAMSPNDIYKKADQYLNHVSGDVAPRLASPFPKPSQTYEQQPLDYPTSTSPKSHSPSTPRIGYKINSIEQKDLLFKDIPVKVAEIINPVNFYLVIQDRGYEYDALKLELKDFYEENCFPLPINKEFFYAAKMEGTDEWGRVQILNHTSKFCCCYFIDEGVTFYISEEKLFLLDDRFKGLPPRSFKAGLLGINSPIWPISTTNQFKMLVLGKSLMAFVQTVDNNVYKCILANGINVNEEISKVILPEGANVNFN